MTRAILSHADYSGVPRESLLEKTLFACDEMAGFVTAASLVRPSKSVLDLEPASVVKRMKDKAFARAVKREDLRAGAELLGLPLETHIGNVITFMRAAGRCSRLARRRCNAHRRTPNAERRTAVYPPEMSERPPVVTLDGVTVLYGAQRALHDVTARFAAGAVGLLGPNGAGKSTMIKALLGFVKPSAGTMRVLGYDVAGVAAATSAPASGTCRRATRTSRA